MLSPLLYSLYIHDCMAKYDYNTIIKCVDDTTLTTMRQPIGRRLETW